MIAVLPSTARAAVVGLVLVSVSCSRAPEKARQGEGAAVSGGTSALVGDFPELPKPGSKVPLDPGHYFVYSLASPPRLGTVIMKVEVFTTDGRPDTSFKIMGDADMPSMRGAHSTGNRAFAVSAKGAYLLPVPLVMPGGWEIRLGFERDGRSVLRGAYLFEL
jgi:hypothetical protein